MAHGVSVDRARHSLM